MNHEHKKRMSYFGCRFNLLLLLVIFCTWPQLVKAEVIGELSEYSPTGGETIFTIARRFDLGATELAAANPGVDFSAELGAAKVIIPSAHIVPPVKAGEVVIILSELRLYYRHQDGVIHTFPIAIGKAGWQTPIGITTIVKKRKDPIWYPPQSLREENPALPRRMLAGPDNPLGARALNLGWARFVIHGTNQPNSIGSRSSHGCIRMYPENVERLFDLVQVGTKVRVIDRRDKVRQIYPASDYSISAERVGTIHN